MVKLQNFSHRAMGGEFLVQFWSSSHDRMAWVNPINEGFGIVDEIESKCTDFKDSPFQQINHQAGISPVAVDDEIFSLVTKGIEYSKKSNGAFDLSYASVGHLWRKARVEGKIPNLKDVEEGRKWIDYKRIEMNPERKEVYLPNQRMRIGLGGIGKGYAVDKLFDHLRKVGLVNFLVNGSGDLRVHSTENAPREWRLGIKNPFSSENKVAGLLKVREGGLATSGDYKQYIRSQKDFKRKFHHIIECSSGYPSVDFASVTILAPTALEADVVATTVMSMKEKDALDYLTAERMNYVLIKSNGQVLNKMERR